MKKFLQRCSVGKSRIDIVNRGFTLVELLVVGGLISLFSVVLFKFYSQSNRSQTILIDGLQMQSSIVTGVNKVLREIRNGTEFVAPDLAEPSAALVFSDFENNTVAIFPLLDEKATREESENIYDLFCYKAITKTFNIGSPVHDPGNMSLLCSNLRDIKFRLSNSNSVSITFDFKKGGKDFQAITEGSLMNSGDVN